VVLSLPVIAAADKQVDGPMMLTMPTIYVSEANHEKGEIYLPADATSNVTIDLSNWTLTEIPNVELYRFQAGTKIHDGDWMRFDWNRPPVNMTIITLNNAQGIPVNRLPYRFDPAITQQTLNRIDPGGKKHLTRWDISVQRVQGTSDQTFVDRWTFGDRNLY